MIERTNLPDLEKITPEQMGEWLSDLKEQKLFLADTGIDNKTFYDWRQQEIVSPQQIKVKKENYKELHFSFFEFVWLQIIKDLRLMGLSYEGLRKINKEVWKFITEEEIIALLTDENFEATNKVHPKLATLNKKTQDALKKHKGKKSADSFVLYAFEMVVTNCLLNNEETELLLRYDGATGMLNNVPSFKVPDQTEEFSIHDNYNKEFAPYPHLKIPLAKYLKEFFYFDENAKKLLAFGFINQDEFEVLDVIRNGNLKEITVKMNQKTNTIKSYEFKTDGELLREELYQLTRTFFLKEYQSVSFRWKNERTVYFEKSTKKHKE